MVAGSALGLAACSDGEPQGRRAPQLTEVEAQVAQLRLEVQTLRREVRTLRDALGGEDLGDPTTEPPTGDTDGTEPG